MYNTINQKIIFGKASPSAHFNNQLETATFKSLENKICI